MTQPLQPTLSAAYTFPHPEQRALTPLPEGVQLSVLTPELVERFFHDNPARRRTFLRFLSWGCVGVLLHDDQRWMTHAWMTLPTTRQPPHLPSICRGEAWIFFCRTQEDLQNRGLYRLSLNALLDQAARLIPQRAVYIDTALDNLPSRAAIERVGFQPRGVLRIWSWRRFARGTWDRTLHHPPLLGRPAAAAITAPPPPPADPPATYGTLFQQPWWLDAVAPGQWGMAELCENGQPVARWPYAVQQRLGLTLLRMPPLTFSLGPWVESLGGKPHAQTSRKRKLLQGLLEQLPEHDWLEHRLHYDQQDWLPFYWKSFQQTTRYSYVIPDLSDLDATWMLLEKQRRNAITQARKAGFVSREVDSIEPLIQLSQRTFERQGKPYPWDTALIRRLDAACLKRDARRVIVTFDPQGKPAAAALIVFDAASAYLLMQGIDHDRDAGRANSLGMWHAIQTAAPLTRSFDCEGSMLRGVEAFYRSFATEQRPYLQLSAMSPRMQLISAARQLLQAGRQLRAPQLGDLI